MNGMVDAVNSDLGDGSSGNMKRRGPDRGLKESEIKELKGLKERRRQWEEGRGPGREN